MPRKKPLPDQFTAALQLKCPNDNCKHEFSKEQKGLEWLEYIECPKCKTVVVSGQDKMFHLRAKQVREIEESVKRLRES